MRADLIKKNGIKDKLYGQRVAELIRERYDINSELAILRQRDEKPDEFKEYNNFAEECKKKAREEMN